MLIWAITRRSTGKDFKLNNLAFLAIYINVGFWSAFKDLDWLFCVAFTWGPSTNRSLDPNLVSFLPKCSHLVNLCFSSSSLSQHAVSYLRLAQFLHKESQGNDSGNTRPKKFGNWQNAQLEKFCVFAHKYSGEIKLCPGEKAELHVCLLLILCTASPLLLALHDYASTCWLLLCLQALTKDTDKRLRVIMPHLFLSLIKIYLKSPLAFLYFLIFSCYLTR